MQASQYIRLYELVLEFTGDQNKAKEFVDMIGEITVHKITENVTHFATKTDVSTLKQDIALLRGEMFSAISECKVEVIKWFIGTTITIVGLSISMTAVWIKFF